MVMLPFTHIEWNEIVLKIFEDSLKDIRSLKLVQAALKLSELL